MARILSAFRRALVTALVVSLLPATAIGAQQNRQGGDAQAGNDGDDPYTQVLKTEDYLTPPPEIMEAVLAPRYENVNLGNLDPSGTWFLHTVEDGFPSLEVFARKAYDLGQFQIDPVANRNRRLTTRSDVGYELISVDGARRVRIEVPEGARVSGAEWSPDGSQLAFFAHFDDATHIYVADTDDGESRRITRSPVLATQVTSFEWTADGEEIVTVLIPEGRDPEPVRPDVPETPKVRVTTPERNSLRTYFDLLEDPFEMMLVEYFSTGQLAKIDVDSREVTPIGEPAMIEGLDPSPDGEYFRVTTMKGPLSYIVPVSSAGNVEEIWDTGGNVLATLDENELRDGAQNQGGRGGRGGGPGGQDDRRGLSWRTDGGPGLVYLQREPRPRRAQGADEPAQEEQAEEGAEQTPRKDRVVFWLPPFDSTSTEIVYETEDQIGSARFDESGRVLFLTRREDDTETAHAVFLDDPSQEYLIYEEDTSDLYAAQGSLMGSGGGFGGGGTVRTSSDGRFVFLSGTQYFENPEENAPRPFIDRVEIRTGEKERVFQSSADLYETVSEVLDDDLTRVVVRRQSPTMVPNSWLVNLETQEETQLTRNIDHTPLITAARREQFTITRPDGFSSRVSVTLPHDFVEGSKLPAMFWFYPREYTEQEDYDEGFQRYNKNTFPGIGSRSMEILTLLGYAIVEPDIPIVGPQGQRNDEYVHDLRNTLAAVIDTVSARGWVDRDRLGLGGHSYGAFSTANAMVHTPFFKAGIAGDGNYNRSLTPAGFQSERRQLWEAQDLYIEMSPFFQADRLTGALLMYHGMDDHNVGTHPIHAERMFHALEVLGKTAALYMYPFEDHGPATEETTLDLWARWVAWLEKYVKNHGQEPKVTTEADDSGGSW